MCVYIFVYEHMYVFIHISINYIYCYVLHVFNPHEMIYSTHYSAIYFTQNCGFAIIRVVYVSSFG